jgi:hypothetical protein
MSRRIDLELTSERPDGTWTWRAAGALQPKGELQGSILPGGAKVGDVLRADADFDLDGITVLSVLPPKSTRVEPERLEVIGPQREFQPVTQTLAPRTERRGDRDRRPRGDRPDGDRPPRRDRPDRAPRPEGAARPRRERPAPPPPKPKPKPKKLRPGRAHREELLAALGPAEQPIAEQLFRGGIPAVRTALEEQNAKNATEGLPEVPSATVLAMAESLNPRVRVADWLDRAEAALGDAEEIALRDLRAVVTSADDVAREESTRPLAEQLRAALERRTGAEQSEWLDELTGAIKGGRVVRALRLAARPPQPGEAVPAELATELTDATAAAMTAEITPDRWATLLDALAYSPLRREVTPAGIPPEPGAELLALVTKHAGRTPIIAGLFGVEVPAAPTKRGGRTRPAKAAPAAPAAPAVKRIPPPPTRPAWMGDSPESPTSTVVEQEAAVAPVEEPVTVDEPVSQDPTPETVEPVTVDEPVSQDPTPETVEPVTVDEPVAQDPTPETVEPATVDEPVAQDPTPETVEPATVDEPVAQDPTPETVEPATVDEPVAQDPTPEAVEPATETTEG